AFGSLTAPSDAIGRETAPLYSTTLLPHFRATPVFLIDRLILLAGVLILLGIASSKLSARLGLPVLVLFLALGMLAGDGGIGGISFNNPTAAHALGTLALAIILYDGGLQTPISSIRSVWK